MTERRKLVIRAFVTLDGVMQAPGGPDEDRSGGFAHGGWLWPFAHEEMEQATTEFLQNADVLLLGRKTYEIFASYWPNMEDDTAIGARLNAMPKLVASRTLEQTTWRNTTIIDGPVAKAIRALKREGGGPIVTQGSADLIQTLLREDLVDEFVVLTFPVTVGAGKRLFGEGTRAKAMRLVSTQSFPTGVVLHRYVADRALEPGSMNVEGEATVTSGDEP